MTTPNTTVSQYVVTTTFNDGHTESKAISSQENAWSFFLEMERIMLTSPGLITSVVYSRDLRSIRSTLTEQRVQSVALPNL